MIKPITAFIYLKKYKHILIYKKQYYKREYRTEYLYTIRSIDEEKKQSITFLLCEKNVQTEGAAATVHTATVLVMLFYILFLLYSIR